MQMWENQNSLYVKVRKPIHKFIKYSTVNFKSNDKDIDKRIGISRLNHISYQRPAIDNPTVQESMSHTILHLHLPYTRPCSLELVSQPFDTPSLLPPSSGTDLHIRHSRDYNFLD